MRVALIQCPAWWTVDPPLGLAQIAGCMKSRGHEAAVFDLNILFAKRSSKSYENLWDWEQFHFWNRPEMVAGFFRDNAAIVEEQVEAILATGARLIGFSVYAGSQLASLELARRIKRADASRKIVFGGQFFHLGGKKDEILREPAVDGVVRGAGDFSFPELASRFEAEGELQPVAGAAVRGAGGILDGGPEPEVKNLDAIPFADFTGFPLDLYDVRVRLPIQGSRGCVWKCHFCSSTRFWKGYRWMSGDRIFAEILHQRKLFPWKTHFEFYDITANGDVRALERLCDLILEDQRKNGKENFFGWKINAILRPEMTPELLKKLGAANCHDIIYGVESGSPRVLKLMNKPYRIETAERVLKDTHDAGIKTIGNFMFGFPGETEEDFQETLDFLRRNAKSFDCVYASATFTSLEENSYLSEHRGEFGIREELPGEAHHLYWESEDGKNHYLLRQDRYERFRKLAIALGIDAYKGVNGTVERDKLANLAQYYRYRGDHIQSVRYLLEYLERDLYSEPMRRELAGYRDDMGLLLRALRAVGKANALFAKSPLPVIEMCKGLRALNGAALSPLAKEANCKQRAERQILRAARTLFSMRDSGELRPEGRRVELRWGRSAALSRPNLQALHERAVMMLGLAEAECRSGASRRAAPACAR